MSYFFHLYKQYLDTVISHRVLTGFCLEDQTWNWMRRRKASSQFLQQYFWLWTYPVVPGSIRKKTLGKEIQSTPSSGNWGKAKHCLSKFPQYLEREPINKFSSSEVKSCAIILTKEIGTRNGIWTLWMQTGKNICFRTWVFYFSFHVNFM